MATRKAWFAALMILVGGTLAMGGTAEQYRGPTEENPRGIAPPGYLGLAGTNRLISRSGEVEGLSRWEFWWEINRDRFLRRAFELRSAQRADDISAQIFATGSPLIPLVELQDVKTRILPLLASRLRSGDPEERAIAALALGRAGVTAAFGPLRSLLDEGTVSDRRAAALALGLLGEPLAAPALIEVMKRSGIAPRERAYPALALGLLRAKDAGPALAKALLDSLRFRGRGVSEFQSAAATALGLIGDPAHAKVLMQVATGRANRSDAARASAIVALGRLGDEAAVSPLIRLLDENKVDMRRAAVQALGILRRPEAMPALVRAYTDDSDVHVRGLAAVAIAEIGDPSAGKLLEGGLAARNSRAVRGFSALALGLLGDTKRAPGLRSVLSLRGEPSLRSAAAIGLALLRDTNAQNGLRSIAFAESEDEGLRGYAVEALALMGDPVLRTRVSRLARDPGAEGLRRSSTRAIGLYGRLPAAPAVLGSLFEEADARVRGSAIVSLGLYPRRNVLEPLVTVAGGRGFSADARKDALSALGVLAARGKPSAVEPLLVHASYRTLRGAVSDAIHLF